MSGYRVVLTDSIEAIACIAKELRDAGKPRWLGALDEIPTLATAAAKLTLEERAALAVQVGTALARIVPLLRKAYGLDDGNDGQPFEEALLQWAGQKAAAERDAGG